MEESKKEGKTHMTKEVLNASVDTIVCTSLHKSKDVGLHVYILNEGRYRDET